jgi:hypothetical protein
MKEDRLRAEWRGARVSAAEQIDSAASHIMPPKSSQTVHFPAKARAVETPPFLFI